MSYRSQALASTLFGTPLAFALAAIYAQFGPGSPGTNFIVAMILLLPVWSAIMTWGLKRKDHRIAWAGLGGALALAAIFLFAARKALGG